MIHNLIYNLTYEYGTHYQVWKNSESKDKQSFCSLYKLIYSGLDEAQSHQNLWIEIAVSQQYFKDKEQLNALFQRCIRE